MKVEYCILDTKTNRYFFHCPEHMVDDHLSVHKENCKEDKIPVWLVKKSRVVGDWE